MVILALGIMSKQPKHLLPSKTRNWCITYFSKEPIDEFDDIRQLEEYWSCVTEITKRAVAQLEKCPKSGRLHLQGYVEFEHPITFRCAKRKLGERVSIRHRAKSRRAAAEYCIDPQKRWPDERGCPYWHPSQEGFGPLGGEQGKRTDLSDFVDTMLLDGLDEAIDRDPTTYVRYHRGLERLHNRRLREKSLRDAPKQVHVLWGKSGVGKTRHVYETHGYRDVFSLHLGNVEWWDGYYGQPVLLIDEFYGQLPISRLLKLLDRHPINLPTKGAWTYPVFQVIYLTSNVHWREWYKEHFEKYPEHITALRRRFTSVTQFGNINDVLHYEAT